MIRSLRKRPTYDELAEIVENNDDIIKTYPDRRAITMRNHPYLTTLDGESFLNALNFTQENMIKAQQRDLLIRTYATQTDELSHLEFKALSTKDASTHTLGEKPPLDTRNVATNTQIRGREPMLETKEIGTGDGRIHRKDMGTTVQTPSPERRNLAAMFDLTVDDATMKEEVAQDISKHMKEVKTKFGKKTMRLYKKNYRHATRNTWC